MHAVAAEVAGQLHAGHQGQPGRERLAGLLQAGQRVVVGERDHVQARGAGAAHHLSGRVGAVRGGAVRMKVDAHE